MPRFLKNAKIMAKNNKKNIPSNESQPNPNVENTQQAANTQAVSASFVGAEKIEPQPSTALNFFNQHWLSAIIIFLISCVIYSNTITHNYAVDDAIVITRNQFTRQGLKGMKGIWYEDTFVGFFGKKQQLVTGGRYRPFSVATFALEMALFGDHPKDGQGNYIKDAQGDYQKNAEGNYLYDCSPATSHSINIILYGLLCMLIYFCVLQLFRARIKTQLDEEGEIKNPNYQSESIKAGFIAFAAALLYATHPLHTEAIANIKGRDEILVMLGSMMALHYAVKAALTPNTAVQAISWVLATVGFLMGIFSKESAIPFLAVIPAALYIFVPKVAHNSAKIGVIISFVAPAVSAFCCLFVQLIDPWLPLAILSLMILPTMVMFFIKRSEGMKIVAILLPFVIITAIFWDGIRKPILHFDPSSDPMAKILDELSASMYKGHKTSFFWVGNEPTEIMNNPFLKLERGMYRPYNDSERMGTILYTWAFYLKLLAVPHPLTNDYYPRHIPVQDKDATAFHDIPKMGDAVPMFSFLLHAFLGFYGLWAVYKRQPIGFCLLFYFATFSVVSNFFFPIGTNMAERFMFMPSLAFSIACAIGLAAFVNKEKQDYSLPLVIMGILAALYSYKTFDRNFAWKDDYTLFTTDIEVSKNSAKLNNAVSGVLQDYINREPDPAKREAIARKALGHSTKAIRMHPTYNNAWLLFGNANAMLAKMNEVKPDSSATKEALRFYDEAIKAYIEVRRLRPDHPDVPQNLSVTYRDLGRLQAEKYSNMVVAAQLFEESSKWFPNDPETWRLLGIAQGMLQQPNKAVGSFQKAISLNPNVASIWYNLSVAYSQLGDTARAGEAMNKSKQLDPNYNPNGVAPK